jgi:hypothetical protein
MLSLPTRVTARLVTVPRLTVTYSRNTPGHPLRAWVRPVLLSRRIAEANWNTKLSEPRTVGLFTIACAAIRHRDHR